MYLQYLLEKYTYKWTLSVQTHVIWESNVLPKQLTKYSVILWCSWGRVVILYPSSTLKSPRWSKGPIPGILIQLTLSSKIHSLLAWIVLPSNSESKETPSFRIWFLVSTYFKSYNFESPCTLKLSYISSLPLHNFIPNFYNCKSTVLTNERIWCNY